MRRAILFLLAGASLLASGVARADAPSNDNFASATVIDSLPFYATIDTVEATSEEVDSTWCISNDEHSVWYRYTPASDDAIVVSIDAGSGDGAVAIMETYEGNLYTNDCYFSGGRGLSYVTAGKTYYIEVASMLGATVDLDLAPPPHADLAITKISVHRKPMTTPLGNVPSERIIRVDVQNNGPDQIDGARVYGEICSSIGCRFIAGDFPSLQNGDTAHWLYTWDTKGYVGDVTIFIDVGSPDTPNVDPIYKNNHAQIEQHVLIGGTGYGVGRCAVLVCV